MAPKREALNRRTINGTQKPRSQKDLLSGTLSTGSRIEASPAILRFGVISLPHASQHCVWQANAAWCDKRQTPRNSARLFKDQNLLVKPSIFSHCIAIFRGQFCPAGLDNHCVKKGSVFGHNTSASAQCICSNHKPIQETLKACTPIP